MRVRRILWLIALFAFVLPSFMVVGAAIQDASTTAIQTARIEGRVLTSNGKPLEGVRVTIKNDVYSPLRSVITDGAGRFKFTGSAGAYYVEVDPLDKPFKRTEERFDFNPSPFSKLGEAFFIDIVLKPVTEMGVKPKPDPTTVFYQPIPDNAKAEYERGVTLLAKNADEAYAALRKALQLYPDYYAAMETLGGAYVKEGHLDHALPILLHAIEVNPEGSKSYYALGVLFYQKGYHKNAVKAFNAVLKNDSANTNATVYLGLALMRNGQEDEAEKTIKKAYQLGAKNVPDLQLALSSIYIKQKRYEEAIGEIQRLLNENPDRKDRPKLEELIKSLRAKPAEKSPASNS